MLFFHADENQLLLNKPTGKVISEEKMDEVFRCGGKSAFTQYMENLLLMCEVEGNWFRCGGKSAFTQ